jgi:hypothetical protein
MFDSVIITIAKIVSTIALALFDYLEKRVERGSTATDAYADRPRLRSAGLRIREWMQAHGASPRRKPPENGE